MQQLARAQAMGCPTAGHCSPGLVLAFMVCCVLPGGASPSWLRCPAVVLLAKNREQHTNLPVPCQSESHCSLISHFTAGPPLRRECRFTKQEGSSPGHTTSSATTRPCCFSCPVSSYSQRTVQKRRCRTRGWHSPPGDIPSCRPVHDPIHKQMLTCGSVFLS